MEAEGFANALARIHEVGQGLDANTMALQYLEMMKELGASENSRWIVPVELTRFLANFGGTGASGDGQR